MASLPHAGTALRVGHVYLDVPRRRLRYLNAIAKELRQEGVPFVVDDLATGALRTLAGDAVTAGDLPLYVAWRDGRPAEAEFFLPRPGGPDWLVAWSASPLWGTASRLDGVLGTVTCGPPGPDPRQLAELSHDLRTPLHVLRVQCAVLEAQPSADAETAQGLEVLRNAADRAVKIAMELLDSCRGPAPRTRAASVHWFALEPFLAGLAAEQAVAARDKGLALHADVAAVHGWQARSDPMRLGRLLANLLTNAVRYTSQGGVVLKAEWREEAAQRQLAVSVLDTGPGITEEEQESIFHAYKRGKAGQGDDSGGSGLGLAVVDRLAAELGVRIEVESHPGRGSTFQLLLPPTLLRLASP
jgi:hypothetical protein